MKILDLKFIIILLFSQVVLSQSSSIDNDLRRNEVSSYSLLENENIEKREAFRTKSKAKVEDLYSYLNIIGNIEYKDDIRKHTVSLVKKLFVANSEINDVLNSNKPVLVDNFIQTLLQSKESIEFSINNINIEASSISYFLTYKKGGNTSKTTNMSQKVYWNYEIKKFGNNSKKVLISNLGSVELSF